jgi:hypothetical protein
MSTPNPYAAPMASLDSAMAPMATSDGQVPDGAMRALQGTKPWVTFLAILGFVFTGLMILGGLAITATGTMSDRNKLGSGIGIVYVFLGALYFAPSFLLLRYGAAIRRLLDGGGTDALTEALVRQKSFWRLIGIATLVILGFYFLAMIALVIGIASRH